MKRPGLIRQIIADLIGAAVIFALLLAFLAVTT